MRRNIRMEGEDIWKAVYIKKDTTVKGSKLSKDPA